VRCYYLSGKDSGLYARNSGPSAGLEFAVDIAGWNVSAMADLHRIPAYPNYEQAVTDFGVAIEATDWGVQADPMEHGVKCGVGTLCHISMSTSKYTRLGDSTGANPIGKCGEEEGYTQQVAHSPSSSASSSLFDRHVADVAGVSPKLPREASPLGRCL
jgi:hypothetical protein